METLTNKRQHEHGGNKQTLTKKRQQRSDSPAPGPCWLLLNSSIDDVANKSSVADAKTAAASCTSSGNLFRISFGVAAPPASCSLHFDWLDGGGGTPGNIDGKHSQSEAEDDVRIIAGHHDTVLIEVRVPIPVVHRGDATFDYFLYEAAGGARPPSLTLLPGCYIRNQLRYSPYPDSTPSSRPRWLGMQNTGILHRGEDDDLVVCQIQMPNDPLFYNRAELFVLRTSGEWIVRRVPILEHREGSSKMHPWHWQNLILQATVAVGNRFLCWVYYTIGFILCDMEEEETPKLRYVPLPATPPHDGYCSHWPDYMQAHYTLGAAGPDAVRFVSVSPPRCCLGDDPGKRSCEGSSSSLFSVTTWTTTLSMEGPTTWVKDIVLDCNEIWKWRLPNNGCLPRDKHLEYPMVSSDDPDVIYFKVSGMAIAINTRSKKLLSVVSSGTGDEDSFHLITAKLGW